jgi:hypothetical protein
MAIAAFEWQRKKSSTEVVPSSFRLWSGEYGRTISRQQQMAMALPQVQLQPLELPERRLLARAEVQRQELVQMNVLQQHRHKTLRHRNRHDHRLVYRKKMSHRLEPHRLVRSTLEHKGHTWI